MTKTSRKWRDKKINKKRVMNKIHNVMLRTTTGIMFVFFLLPFCSETKNVYLIGGFVLSTIWLYLVYEANKVKEGDCVQDNYDRWKQYDSEQQERLEELPRCECCEEYIQDEFAYRIGNELICHECLDLNYKEAI